MVLHILKHFLFFRQFCFPCNQSHYCFGLDITGRHHNALILSDHVKSREIRVQNMIKQDSRLPLVHLLILNGIFDFLGQKIQGIDKSSAGNNRIYFLLRSILKNHRVFRKMAYPLSFLFYFSLLCGFQIV